MLLLLLYAVHTIVYVALSGIIVVSVVGIVIVIVSVVDVAQCCATPSMSLSLNSC